jgi:hypothetical protein
MRLSSKRRGRFSHLIVLLCTAVIATHAPMHDAQAQTSRTNFPTLPEISAGITDVRGQVGEYSPYNICTDFVNSFYNLCRVRGWHCIPYDTNCGSLRHALALVYVSPTQCVLADPTNNTIVSQLFDCADFRARSSNWLTGAPCPGGSGTCRCDLVANPTGWQNPVSDPRSVAFNHQSYWGWAAVNFIGPVFGDHRNRVQVCTQECLNISAMHMQISIYEVCSRPPAYNTPECRARLDSVTNWVQDCAMACRTLLG